MMKIAEIKKIKEVAEAAIKTDDRKGQESFFAAIEKILSGKAEFFTGIGILNAGITSPKLTAPEGCDLAAFTAVCFEALLIDGTEFDRAKGLLGLE